MGMITKEKPFEEGELICRWMHSRLVRQNKNVLGVNLGPTGSGKSYRDLRIAELWYKYYHNKPFPVENICFGTKYALERLQSGQLGKADLLIYEEAGVNMGNLDFQNRTSKMFSYVLQSFRSQNIGILFNLPYLTMLNKTARTLLHYSMVSKGIDHQRGLNFCKPYLHQVNQSSGKIYTKNPRVKIAGRVTKIETLSFSKPSQYLVDAYESKKSAYLNEMQQGFLKEIHDKELKESGKKELRYNQRIVFDLFSKGMKPKDIAQKIEVDVSRVHHMLAEIEKKGYILPIF